MGCPGDETCDLSLVSIDRRIKPAGLEVLKTTSSYLSLGLFKYRRDRISFDYIIAENLWRLDDF
jgi:hypothetical protein